MTTAAHVPSFAQPAAPSFKSATVDTICADVNYDGAVNIADVLYLLDGVFKCAPAPQPICLGDTNGDGKYNVGDAVYLLEYIFRGSLPPVPCYTDAAVNVVIDRQVKCGD